MSEESTTIPTPGSEPARPLVVLLLPLSGKAAAAADAVRDGFLSAYFALDPAQRPRVRVIDSAHSGAAAAYAEAVAGGCHAIVGPLTKEDAAAVVALPEHAPLTLLLNALADGVEPPPRVYQFALSPEDEARQVAQGLVAAGKLTGVTLTPSGDWGRRVLDAFQGAFTAGGGTLATSRTYPGTTTDFSGYIGELIGFEDSRARHRALVQAVGVPLEFTPRRRDTTSFLFVAGQPVQGRLIRAQLKYNYAGELPLYSISDMYEPAPTANQDLEGLIFTDMPWMIENDAATMGARDDAQSLWSDATKRRSRLYAFGADAFRLLAELESPETFRDTLSGYTGRLTLGAQGRIQRTLDWGKVQPDGTVRVVPGA